VTDDGSNSIWRIDYVGSTMPANSQIASAPSHADPRRRM
jgi:hypothetical protein